MRSKQSILSHALGCTLLVLISATSLPRATFAAQDSEANASQKNPERVVVDAEEIIRQVEEELDRIDIDAIVHQAMEGARISLEQARIQQQVLKCLEKVDIEQIVSNALASAQRSIEAAKVQNTVREALQDVEVERIKAEALRDAQKALEEAKSEIEKAREKTSEP